MHPSSAIGIDCSATDADAFALHPHGWCCAPHCWCRGAPHSEEDAATDCAFASPDDPLLATLSSRFAAV